MKMMLIKCWFFLLTISAIEASRRLWKLKNSSIEESVTKEIIETCYGGNYFEEVIFIFGDFNEVIDKASIIRMNNLLVVEEDYEDYKLYPIHPFSSIGVTKVLIIEDSPERLHSELISFKGTRWWNHMLPFLIIGKNDEKCENFEEILNTTWRMDILDSIYICSGIENTTLYTLNPITNYAPDPWKRTENSSDSNIFHQIFDPHTSCNNLNFDKTKILNGYQIKAIIDPDPQVSSPFYRSREYFNPRLFELIIEQLNASVIYERVSKTELIDTLKEGDADVTYSVFMFWKTFDLAKLFLIEEKQYAILIKSNELTVLQKIRYLWSTQVLCMAAVALMILFLTLIMKNGDVTSAMLDIVRFFTYVSIRTDTRSNSFRIYFTTMLIFIVISNGVFQGKIAAFLTKPDKVPPIKTVEELKDSGHIVYVLYSQYWTMILGFDDSKAIVVDNDDVCIDYVLKGTLNVCVIPLWLYEQKHLLKPLDRVVPQSDDGLDDRNWHTRSNWPLFDRFNHMLMRSIDTGIYENLRGKEFYEMKEKRKADDHELALAEIVPPYRPIELVKLNFAFKLLAIGLLLATFVLIIELRMRGI